MRQQPQLDLRVVRVHQHAALPAAVNMPRRRLPSSVRVGIFCKFGSVELSLPVAVAVIWKLVRIRPSMSMTFNSPST